MLHTPDVLIELAKCIFFDVFISANEENYQLRMSNDSQPSGLDVSSYTIEEIDSITSEYTLKNTVSFFFIYFLFIFNFSYLFINVHSFIPVYLLRPVTIFILGYFSETHISVFLFSYH